MWKKGGSGLVEVLCVVCVCWALLIRHLLTHSTNFNRNKDIIYQISSAKMCINYFDFSLFLRFFLSFFILLLSFSCSTVLLQSVVLSFTKANFARPTLSPRTYMPHRRSRKHGDVWSGIRTRHSNVKVGCVYCGLALCFNTAQVSQIAQFVKIFMAQ
jgi:hypothetical protein